MMGDSPKPLEHHSTIVLRGLRGLSIWPPDADRREPLHQQCKYEYLPSYLMLIITFNDNNVDININI